MLTALLAMGLSLLVAPVAQGAEIPVPEDPQPGWGVNGTVWAVEFGAGVAYVAGDFTQVSGSNGTRNRQRIAAFDISTGAVTGFRADANARVRSLALAGSSLFVGGDFTSIGGQDRSRLAELDADSGAVVTEFRNNVTSSVRSLAVSGDRLYLGGNFGQVAGVRQPNAAAIDLRTRSMLRSFDPDVDRTVQAVAASPDGQRVYLGGDFLNIDGQGRRYLAALSSAGDVLPIDFEVYDRYVVRDLDVNDTGSRVFAAIMGAGNQAASFDASDGDRLWRQRAEGDVQTVSYYRGNVYFGLHEGFDNDFDVRLLAADAVSGSLESDFRPTMNSYWGVWAVDAGPAGVLAGGEFTQVNGRSSPRVAYFASSTAPPPPADPLPPTADIEITSVSDLSVAVSGGLSSDADGRIDEYSWQFGDGGTAVGLEASHTYAAGGRYQITLTVTDNEGLSDSATADVTVTEPPAPEDPPSDPSGPGSTDLVTSSAPGWRYYDEGAASGQWPQLSFDDSSWAVGSSELGYGDGDEATVISFGGDPNDKYLTSYFRQGFQWDGSHAAESLILRLVADDGAVVYINGQEVARDNMPSGDITFDTYASTGRWGDAEQQWREFSVDPSILQIGDNVLAAEVHQNYRRSGDLSFNAALTVSSP